MERMNKKGKTERILAMVPIALMCVVFFVGFVFADPTGPGSSNINVTSNETYAGQTTGDLVNISGGRIAAINISANVINPRWKAFVGWVNGQLALRDATGDTIYDWTLAVSSGEVYATRTSGTVTWAGINCSNLSVLEAENVALGHSNIYDNITATFSEVNHSAFVVASETILSDSCYSTNTYINNVSQGLDFEEVILYDGTNNVFATILEDNLPGFDGTGYDFQMIIPQNATIGAANTPYYIFVEIS
jgi:hypothetical protein